MAPEVGQSELQPFQRRTLHKNHPLLKPHLESGSGYYVRDRFFPNSAESVMTRIVTTAEETFARRHDDEDMYDSLSDDELARYRDEIEAIQTRSSNQSS